MTQTVPDRPRAGSVESFVAIYRGRPGVETLLENRALGVIQAVAEDYHLTADEKVTRIRNALAAVQRVYEELATKPTADPTGLLFTRADTEDDLTPVSPAARGLNVGAVTDGGLVDETEAQPGGVFSTIDSAADFVVRALCADPVSEPR